MHRIFLKFKSESHIKKIATDSFHFLSFKLNFRKEGERTKNYVKYNRSLTVVCYKAMNAIDGMII